jgi:hypothetical protein
VQQLQATIYHLDAALAAFGHGPAKTYQRRFTNGELIRLIGDAERAGAMTPTAQARWMIKAKGWDQGGRQGACPSHPPQRQGMPEAAER